MSHRERLRPRTPSEGGFTGGLGNPFALDGEAGGPVTVEHGVYTEQLPVAGRTVGEIRRVVAPRYDIGPEAGAFLDDQAVGDETVVREGQSVRFMHLSGEKGQRALQELRDLGLPAFLAEALLPPVSRRRTAPPKVTIEGSVVSVTTREGRRTTMDLEDVLAALAHVQVGPNAFGDVLLPDGVKLMAARQGRVVLVHQTPPAVHRLRWIARNSPVRHGKGTVYREVTIALPYVIVFAVFDPMRGDRLRLSDRNECFFTKAPLRSPDDPLYYPALLNCSRIERPSRPLSWICTQHLKRTKRPAGAGPSEVLRIGLTDILRCLLETGFNYSSEAHELSSWFTESNRVDPRVSTIERWEEATRDDPLFVLDVPWIEVGGTLADVTERCLRLAGGSIRPRTSHDVARLLRNRGKVEQVEGGSAK